MVWVRWLGVAWLLGACVSGRTAESVPPAPVVDPHRDVDGDGVPDAQDGCPETRAPGRGCPIHDEDPGSEAAIAVEDECPSEPETINGFKENDGCPDKLPEPLAMMARRTLPMIPFVRGRTLAAKQRKKADEVAETLRDFPQMRIEISGHTDSLEGGDAAGREALGRARAALVRELILKQVQVDPEQLVIRSAGADEPLDSNRTKAGRARNRRVEFTILIY